MPRYLTAPASALVVVLLMAAASSGAFAASAASADEITWGVQPANADGSDGRAYLEYSIDPGTQVTDWVAITNQGSSDQVFTVYGTDAINDYTTGAFGLLPAEDKPRDAGSWIRVLEKEVAIEAGRQAIVPIQVLIPSDATPGDHSAGVIASVASEGVGEDGQAVTLDLRVAARVYVRVSGELSATVDIVGLTTSYAPSLNPFAAGTMTVDYDIANTGNIRLDVDQAITVTGPVGIPLATITTDPVRNLLPGQSVHITTALEDVGAAGLTWTTVTLTPDAASNGRVAAPEGADSIPAAGFSAVSEQVIGLAASWTLATLVGGVLLGAYLILRWMSRTRSAFYDAVDAAVAQAESERDREMEGSTRG